jgi:4-aminobutyrate aminotransferase-like enzyme
VSADQPIGPNAILDKKAKFLIPCTYSFYKNPPQMVRGEGVYVFDSENRRYADLYSGVSVHALGHCHREMTDAICDQVRTLQHITTIYLTEPIVNLAEAIAKIMPGEICRTFFCASGSEANEGAALLATLYTGRSDFFVLKGGLHGRTKLGMSLTGLDMWRTDPQPVGGITQIPAPHCLRCPFSKTYGKCSFECVAAVEKAIDPSSPPAAMFVEPVQGNGGIIVPPPTYFERLQEVLKKFDVLLIADEVQTGFGRTGKMFAMNHWGVAPDIMTGGKSLGGGTPVGFFATTDAIASCYTKPGASTFGGNPVTAVAGLAFLKILQRDDLVNRSAHLGKLLKNKLEGLSKRAGIINEVRGLGLMIGVEIGQCGDYTPADMTDHILEKMKDRGFLLGKTGPGRNVLTFMPPFIINESELENAVDALEEIIKST